MIVLNIPLQDIFFEKVADFILNNIDIHNTIIFLPSRRSCNELKRLLLQQSKTTALILPVIKAIGDIDYDDLTFKETNDYFLTHKVTDFSRTKYKLLLLKELQEWSKNSTISLFKNISFSQMCNLATELEKFLNDVCKNELDLKDLYKIVDDEYSQHWQEILQFLQVFSERWQSFTITHNMITTTEYTTQILKHNTEYFKQHKPKENIVFIGITNHIKSTCDFIGSLVNYSNCYYIFRGVDFEMTNNEWGNINEKHPQFLQKYMLEEVLKHRRESIKNI